MAATWGGSWYVAAKPSTYSIAGFITALIGGTLLAGGLDLLGQFIYAVATGGSVETTLQAIAGAVVDPGMIADPQQYLLIGAAVHFAIILAMTLAYLIAASRIALINSAPEISTLWFGLLIALVMIWIVVPLRWPQDGPVTTPIGIIGQIVRHTVLVAMPIAALAKATARSR